MVRRLKQKLCCRAGHETLVLGLEEQKKRWRSVVSLSFPENSGLRVLRLGTGLKQRVSGGRLGGKYLWNELERSITGREGWSMCSAAKLGVRLHNFESSNIHPVGFLTATGIGKF